MIGKRTRHGLGRRQGSGQQLGDAEIGKHNRAAADAHAESLREVVTPLAVAKALNDRGIATPRGGRWQSPQVMRLLDPPGL